MSDSLRPHGLQHARLLCPSPSPGVCSNSCPLSPWCHPTISSSVVPFCPQSFPTSVSFPMSQRLVFNSVVHLNSSNNLEFIFIYEKRQRGTFVFFLDLVSSFWIHPVFHHVSPPPLSPARPEPSFVSQGSLQGPCSAFSGSSQFGLNQQPEQPFSNVNQTLQLSGSKPFNSSAHSWTKAWDLLVALGLHLPYLLSCPFSHRPLPLVYPDRSSGNSAEICLFILGSERSKLCNTWARPPARPSPALQFECGVLSSSCLLQMHIFIWSF